MARPENPWDMLFPIVHRQSVKKSYERYDWEAFVGTYGADGPLHGYPTAVVTSDAPKAMRRAVYKLANMFRRELGFDFPGYSVEEDQEHRAYLWTDALWHSQCDQMAIGACVFWWQADVGSWELGWVWFHPFKRRSGLLGQAWPYFWKRHGPFDIAEPLSEPMERFLIKHRYEGPRFTYRELPGSSPLPIPTT